MGELWLIEGLPGSGKTTFAESFVAIGASGMFYSKTDTAHPVERRELNVLDRFPLRTIGLVNDKRGALEAFNVLWRKEEARLADTETTF